MEGWVPIKALTPMSPKSHASLHLTSFFMDLIFTISYQAVGSHP